MTKCWHFTFIQVYSVSASNFVKFVVHLSDLNKPSEMKFDTSHIQMYILGFWADLLQVVIPETKKMSLGAMLYPHKIL